MKIITILAGIVLSVLAVQYYLVQEAVFPILLGIGMVVLGAIALKSKGKHSNAQFGALLLALFILVGSVFELARLFMGGQTAASAVLIIRLSMVAVSLVFIILGLLLIKDFWVGWKAFGHFLGNALARVVLTIFYFTVFVPFGLGVRWLGDPLHLKSTPDWLWRLRPTGDQTLEEVMRQY
jgi:hypothetical protein